MQVQDANKLFPVVLWAFGIFVLFLGFNFRVDWPLAVFIMAAIYSVTTVDIKWKPKVLWKKHWHVIVFLLASLLVTLCSLDVMQSIKVQPQLVPALLAYAVIILFVNKSRDFDFVLVALVTSGLIAGITLLYSVYSQSGDDILEKVRLSSHPLFVAPNDILMLSVLSPLAAYLLLSARSWTLKVLALTFLLLAFTATMYLRSRQGVAVYLFGIAGFFVLLKPRWGIISGIIGVAVVLVIDVVTGKGLINKFFMFPRIYVWDAAWHMFLDRPITGQGPGTFKLIYYDFLHEAGYVLEQVKDRRPMNWAHSLFFEQLAERGLAGFLALMALLGHSFYLLGRVYFRSDLTRDIQLKVVGLASTLAAFVLAGIAESSLGRLWVILLLFCVVALSSWPIKNAPFNHINCNDNK